MIHIILLAASIHPATHPPTQRQHIHTHGHGHASHTLYVSTHVDAEDGAEEDALLGVAGGAGPDRDEGVLLWLLLIGWLLVDGVVVK